MMGSTDFTTSLRLRIVKLETELSHSQTEYEMLRRAFNDVCQLLSLSKSSSFPARSLNEQAPSDLLSQATELLKPKHISELKAGMPHPRTPCDTTEAAFDILNSPAEFLGTSFPPITPATQAQPERPQQVSKPPEMPRLETVSLPKHIARFTTSEGKLDALSGQEDLGLSVATRHNGVLSVNGSKSVLERASEKSSSTCLTLQSQTLDGPCQKAVNAASAPDSLKPSSKPPRDGCSHSTTTISVSPGIVMHAMHFDSCNDSGGQKPAPTVQAFSNIARAPGTDLRRSVPIDYSDLVAVQLSKPDTDNSATRLPRSGELRSGQSHSDPMHECGEIRQDSLLASVHAPSKSTILTGRSNVDVGAPTAELLAGCNAQKRTNPQSSPPHKMDIKNGASDQGDGAGVTSTKTASFLERQPDRLCDCSSSSSDASDTDMSHTSVQDPKVVSPARVLVNRMYCHPESVSAARMRHGHRYDDRDKAVGEHLELDY